MSVAGSRKGLEGEDLSITDYVLITPGLPACRLCVLSACWLQLENVLLTSQGVYKLIDLGSAVEGTIPTITHAHRHTPHGTLCGNCPIAPSFMVCYHAH